MDDRLRELYARAARTIDTGKTVEVSLPPGGGCEHVTKLKAVQPRTPGCQECLAEGQAWVHLRVCMTCGHVGCCDSSPNRHASKHFHATDHPVIRSIEPGESWSWCYPHQAFIG
jgi:uncharacterized UBP type Zn finger protein